MCYTCNVLNNYEMNKQITILESQVETQTDMILWHLKNHKTITPLEAMREYGIMRLAALIHMLRKEGYNIVSIPTTKPNKFGKEVTFATYKYQKTTV